MEKITPEKVREAMTRTGLKLTCGEYGDGVCNGCPQTILYVDSRPDHQLEPLDRDIEEQVEFWADEKLPGYYALGFRDGFDRPDEVYLPKVHLDTDSYIQGRADGKACAIALFGEGGAT